MATRFRSASAWQGHQRARRARSPRMRIISDHDDFVEGCLEPATAGKLIRLKRTVRRLHNQRPVLKLGFNGRDHHSYSSSCLRF